MHIIITGGLGFIGSRIADRLLGQGHQVTILDNSITSVVNDVPGAEVYQVDLADERAVKGVNLSPASCLMHLAGPSSGPASVDDPVATVASGYRITHSVLELAVRHRVERVLNASSMTVYGNVTADQNPVREDLPCVPISHYAVGKYANERLVEIFCKAHGMRFNNLRLFNVYGPGQDFNRMDQGLVRIFLAMLMNSPKIISRGPLERFRDVVHIEDVVTAWVLCATQNDTDGALNVGSGEALTIKDLIFVISDALGIGNQLEVKVAEGTPGDIYGIVADISALRQATGFSPCYPPNQGVRQFTLYALDNLSLALPC